MKYGKPIIVSDRGALPELVKAGENGYIFDFDNPESLIQILEKLDKKSLCCMGKKAEFIFRGEYRSQKMLGKTFLIYKGEYRHES